MEVGKEMLTRDGGIVADEKEIKAPRLLHLLSRTDTNKSTYCI